ncbi:hypothetical protein KZZ52_19585 [Dactylosporangium sp. AC04546]|uniref:hypothetical protein n=1 Tax=Dactylosporangium sp. AC04546 TaxID=2862460 RepID=UPI001EE11565|nr:hypothetical protein [Dactylosporangium sp. AC04546]WVK87504.1 hypothetical protein KZZ52_19585 [Dactylosporangium sp. AC04546]
MTRLRWWSIGAGAAVVVAVAFVFGLGLPRRSAFLAREAPNACALMAEGASPFGGASVCTPLGRRTPPLGNPDGQVFLLLETSTGPAAVRIDYTRTDSADYTATAVEIPTWEAPGISHDTAERIKEGINQRGGLKTTPWVVHGAA